MDDEPKKPNRIKRRMIIMLVLCVLAVIVLAFTLWGLISTRNKVNTTDALVRSVATAITNYQQKTWQWNEGTASEPRMKMYHIFDLDRDNHIDGYVAVTDGPMQDGGFPPEVIASGYTGFITMAQPQIKKSLISPQGIPIDAWRRPLRITYAAKIYGTQAFGVWSAGLDGVDGTTDDLKSWTPVP